MKGRKHAPPPHLRLPLLLIEYEQSKGVHLTSPYPPPLLSPPSLPSLPPFPPFSCLSWPALSNNLSSTPAIRQSDFRCFKVPSSVQPSPSHPPRSPTLLSPTSLTSLLETNSINQSVNSLPPTLTHLPLSPPLKLLRPVRRPPSSPSSPPSPFPVPPLLSPSSSSC